MKSKSKEVSIRFLSWLIEKSKDRVLDLTIGLNDVSAVYPKTRIEKIIDYLSLTSDYFKSRVIKKLVDARRLEDEGKGRYRFSKFNNQDLLNQENKK